MFISIFCCSQFHLINKGTHLINKVQGYRVSTICVFFFQRAYNILKKEWLKRVKKQKQTNKKKPINIFLFLKKPINSANDRNIRIKLNNCFSRKLLPHKMLFLFFFLICYFNNPLEHCSLSLLIDLKADSNILNSSI